MHVIRVFAVDLSVEATNDLHVYGIWEHFMHVYHMIYVIVHFTKNFIKMW